MSMLKCTKCGDENLYVSLDFDGMDKDSERGEGSGFKTMITLNCPCCGGVYVVGRVKHSADFSLDIKVNHFAYEGMESRKYPRKE